MKSPLCLLLALLAPFASAQVAPAPSAAPSDSNQDTTVLLDPFEVDATKDNGYLSQNTASGSRLNTRLADTPAAISVFTSEFLNDIAATNIADVAKYATNTEFDVGFVSGNPNGNSMMNPSQNLTVRGLPTNGGPATGRTVNFLAYTIEIDTYNIDRVEFSRGPNSILFGLGQAGGTFNVQSRTADVNRPIDSVTLQTGSWNDLRGTIDVNQPIIPGKAAIRVDGVDEHSLSWRPWEYTDNKRAYVALRYELTPKTTLDLESENVTENINHPRPYLGPDMISAWLGAGRPMVTAPSTSSTPDPVSGIRRVSSTDWWSYIWGGASANSAPLLVNFKNTAETANPLASTPITPMVQNFSEIPKQAVLAGEGTYNKFHFSDNTALLRQEFTRNFYMEFAANQQVYNSDQRDINGPDLTLWYDPNTNYYNNPGGGTAATTADPNGGKPYVEMYLQKRQASDRRTDFRDTASYHLDLGPIFGVHDLAGLLEHWEQKSRSATYEPSLFGTPDVANAPESANNLIHERTYVDLNGPVQNIGLADFNNVNLPGVGWIPKATPSYNRYYLNSWMVATQSKFWKDRIVVTAGDREDFLYSKLSSGVRDPNLYGGYTVGFLEPGAAAAYHYGAKTQTYGIVLHATPWAFLFYDHSNDIGLPALNEFTAPNVPVPSPKGVTQDMGVGVSALGGRVTARITYYQTAVVDNATSLGTGNAQLYINNIWADLLAQGTISQSQYTANLVNINAYTFDNASQGWEGEVVANLTSHWRLLANLSENKTSLTNVALPVINYINANEPAWVASGNADVKAQLGSLTAYVTPNLINVSGGSLPLTPKWVGNLRTDYGFTEGWMKGVDAGVGVRTRIGTFLGYTSTDPVTRQALTAGSNTVVDANLGYGGKFAWRNHGYRWKLQVNVNNLLDNERLLPLTENTAGQVLNYRFQTPRQWIFRGSLDF